MTKFISTTNCFVFNDDSKVLMLRRAENTNKFPGYWMGPGGGQESNEDILSTCIREVKEETGLDVSNVQLRIIATHYYPHKDQVYIVFIFSASYKSGDITPERYSHLSWLQETDILHLERLYPDLRIHLPLMFNDKGKLYFTHMEFDENSNIVKYEINSLAA